MGQSAINALEFWFDPPATLAEALRVCPDPVDLVKRLIRASIQGDVRADEDHDGNHTFEVQSSLRAGLLDLVLTRNKELLGAHAGMLERVYAVVRAIETELSDAMYMPSDLRQERVSATCARIGVSSDDFSSILRNWSKF